MLALGFLSVSATAQKTQRDNKAKFRTEQNFKKGITTQDQKYGNKKARKDLRKGNKKFHKGHFAHAGKHRSFMKKNRMNKKWMTLKRQHNNKGRRVI